MAQLTVIVLGRLQWSNAGSILIRREHPHGVLALPSVTVAAILQCIIVSVIGESESKALGSVENGSQSQALPTGISMNP